MSDAKLVLVGAFLVLVCGQVPASEHDGNSDVRAAVQRAIPYLQQQGAAWINDRGCVSCHQVPFMLWSLSAAQQQGFDVDQDALRSWQQWSTQAVNFVAPAQKSEVDVDKTLASNIDTMNALLLAIPSGDGDEDWRDEFTSALVNNQQVDGSWQACGQLPSQKRPKQETTQVTVLWSLLALAQHGSGGHDIEAALEVVENDQPASTEWWVARTLLSHQLADGKSDEFRSRLIANQHTDGGWGWLTDEASDALATGMAIYALRRTGGSQEEALERADRFLTSTQRDDGSWSVPGTKESSRKKSTPTSEYWGTAWAVIGLLEP